MTTFRLKKWWKRHEQVDLAVGARQSSHAVCERVTSIPFNNVWSADQRSGSLAPTFRRDSSEQTSNEPNSGIEGAKSVDANQSC